MRGIVFSPRKAVIVSHLVDGSYFRQSMSGGVISQRREGVALFCRLSTAGLMPTVYRYKGFRLHFYSNEGHEPPHVHVRRGDDSCKFWLRPVRLAYNDGMTSRELNDLSKLVRQRRGELERKWFEYFA